MTIYIVETPDDNTICCPHCFQSGSVWCAVFSSASFAETYLLTTVSGSMHTGSI